LLIVAGREADRSKLEALYEPTAFAPISAGYERVYPDYLEALRPCAAILVRSAAPPARDEEGRPEGAAAELIRRSGVLLLEVGSGAGGEALVEGLVEATYRAVIRADLARILLVDDDARFRSILAKCAEPYCSCTIPAENAELALELLQVGEVDCLVLDLLMPGLDGFGFLTLLRGTAATRSLPVLVCSSKALSKQERVLLQELSAAFLPKDRLDAANLARGLVEARACTARAEGRRS
jgi:CheY-like chemotaxis protein